MGMSKKYLKHIIFPVFLFFLLTAGTVSISSASENMADPDAIYFEEDVPDAIYTSEIQDRDEEFYLTEFTENGAESSFEETAFEDVDADGFEGGPEFIFEEETDEIVFDYVEDGELIEGESEESSLIGNPLSGSSVGGTVIADHQQLGGSNIFYTITKNGSSAVITFTGTGLLPEYELLNGILPDNLNSISVIIEEGITGLNGSFFFWEHLTDISLPESLSSIGEDTFYSCDNLTSITIPDGVTTIEKDAFSQCINLTSVTIPDSVTVIGENAFFNCPKLTAIKIPDSVTSIGDGAFGACESLTSVKIPDSVTTLGMGAFDCCFSLSAVTLPKRITRIEKDTFYLCKELEKITIPDGVTYIGRTAFANCGSLTEAVIPESISKIENNAFESCPMLSIYGQYVSIAEHYANKKGIPFIGTPLVLNESIVPDISDQNYTGSALRPVPVIKYGQFTLKYGRDFTASFSNNKNVGNATCTITGIKRATGTVVKTFQIVAPAGLIQYKVSFHSNGGSGAPAAVLNLSSENTVTLKLPAAVPTRSGYAFKNWNTKKDGTGTAYAKSGKITLKANAPAVMLYAQWTPSKTGEDAKPVKETGSVKLNKTSITLWDMQKCTLKATVKTADGSNTTGIWSSSNKAVATVTQQGIIKALKAGTTMITVKKGKASASCKVTVKARKKLKGFTLNYTKKTIKVGKSFTLKVKTVKPTNASVRVIKSYAIADKKVVKIKYVTTTNSNGVVTGMNAVVTGLKKGKTTIIATSQDGGYRAKCTVIVS